MHRNTLPFSLVLLALLFIASNQSTYSQEKPKTFSVKRYSVMWQNSFFGKVSTPKSSIDFSEDWSLSGVFSFDGGYGAVIVNQSNGDMLQIESSKYDESGYRLAEVSGLKSNKDQGLRVKVADKEGNSFWVANISQKQDLTYRLISSSNKLVSKTE